MTTALRHKSLLTPAPIIDADAGTVVALPSITAVPDNVGDVIEPGAIQRSLDSGGVWPKMCADHQWQVPVGLVTDARELRPGSRELPADLLTIGAGALRCEIKMQLNTQAGRETWENLRLFGGQQGWSIGYQVPPGGERVDPSTGLNHITDIRIFEVSSCLFGCMPLARSLAVKAATGAVGSHPFVPKTESVLEACRWWRQPGGVTIDADVLRWLLEFESEVAS